MTIDAHAHVFNLDGMSEYNNIPLFDYMRLHNIDKSSCIATTYKETDKVIQQVRDTPDKLFGIAYVNVWGIEDSLNNIRKYVNEGLFKGVIMQPSIQYQIDSPMIEPFYRMCIELDIPVLFHNGRIASDSQITNIEEKSLGMEIPFTSYSIQIANILEKYPKLKIVFAHCGGYFYREILALTEKYENAYMDTARLRYYAERTLPTISIYEWIEHAVKFIGSGKILFGGEGTFPIDIEKCNLSSMEKTNILINNSVKLFKL